MRCVASLDVVLGRNVNVTFIRSEVGLLAEPIHMGRRVLTVQTQQAVHVTVVVFERDAYGVVPWVINGHPSKQEQVADDLADVHSIREIQAPPPVLTVGDIRSDQTPPPFWHTLWAGNQAVEIALSHVWEQFPLTHSEPSRHSTVVRQE